MTESPYIVIRGCVLALILAVVCGIPFMVWSLIALLIGITFWLWRVCGGNEQGRVDGI